ncbi:hypothetical protein [Streptoalloteichus hindustanus]|uniref:Uncharacterized protein n=1 Tax=Streptoalloteichus hindustanus TaxID=2017 RepID=A0A1M5NAL7_STRHI|nr:hypothetical protein [Streptoalloteichus hindustanus]SHG86560.1 hypothetical protein SAMN05444320_11558 [Streptoalloteichus hindustanus]
MAAGSFDDHYYDVPDLRDVVARFGLVGALERVNSQAIHPELPALRSCWREASTERHFGGVPRLTSLQIHLANTAPVRQNT